MEHIEKKYLNKTVLNYDRNVANFVNNSFIDINIDKNREYFKKILSLDKKSIKNKYIKFYNKANELHLNCINALISYITQLEKYKEDEHMYKDDILYILKYEFELSYNKNWREYICDFDINEITKSKDKISLYHLFKNRLIKLNHTVISFEKCYKFKFEEYNRTINHFDRDFFDKIVNLYTQLSKLIILYYEFISKLSKSKREIFLNYSKDYFIPNITINYDIKM